ncbi:MAG TPA: 2-oxoglutarate and iron-dependent oxygenase domain-containing protein [Bryobacteraceae bacterium]|nr:2-oxoglutarate and iron-dependent oxygenase domain-containing protein [Bryobacteraceae bacterium]
MPHTGFTELPIVDVSGLNAVDPADRRAAAERLGDAARHFGFFYVVGHGVAPALMHRLTAHAGAFFALPPDEKMRWYIGKSRHHKGYVPEGEEVLYSGARDRKEAFDLGLDLAPDDPEVQRGTPMLGPNVWPDLPDFAADVGAYYEAVFRFSKVLFRGFALALSLEESYFDAFVTKPPSQLRLIHYTYNPAAVDAQGIGAHTDYECFTILLATAPGLEVMNGAGVWIDAPPVEGAFVVNIGDLMEIWTNGEFVATSHRVRRVSQERYSFPLFCACDYHTRVEPLPALVTPERPSAYASVVAGEHLFAQTAQSFTYLKARLERGEIRLPDAALPLSSFGQEARQLNRTAAAKPA